jgi:hypothetical protein
MKSLIWKEWRENVKWAAVPGVLMLGPTFLFGVPMLMEPTYLAYVSLVAALSGASLGFLQIAPEARGDKRSLLLHRPLSPSRIFLAKVVAGTGLYLISVLLPTACTIALAATPGHVAAPFQWRMTLPWLADSLTGLVYYFAGMLTAQREARWYGSRCLPLAAGLFASMIVWNVTEFSHALVAISALGALVAVAAWGSIVCAGVDSRQPPVARFALAATLLAGLFTLGFVGKVAVGLWLEDLSDYQYELHRDGRLFVVNKDGPRITSVNYLDGSVPERLKEGRLGWYAINEIRVRAARANPLPECRSYRNPGQCLVSYRNKTTSNHEAWWYVPSEGRILGYDKSTKRFLGSVGPDGFVPPDEQHRETFRGDVAQKAMVYESFAFDPLCFPTAVYNVDFRMGKVRLLFQAPPGERIRWASHVEDEREGWSMYFVGTERRVHFLDQAGNTLVAAPIEYDQATDRILSVGHLVKPDRFFVWYFPQWYLPLHTHESIPEARVVVYDRSGCESQPRQEVMARRGVARDGPCANCLVEPHPYQALSGLFTSPTEYAVLAGITSFLERQARTSGTEPLLLQHLLFATQAYLPGVRWDLQAHPGLTISFGGLMLLATLGSAVACYWLPRRYAFSRARRWGWAAIGLFFGPTGFLLMISFLEWLALVACANCRQARVVTRERCEHCGATHAVPEPDGTEIFEPLHTVSRLEVCAK